MLQEEDKGKGRQEVVVRKDEMGREGQQPIACFRQAIGSLPGGVQLPLLFCIEVGSI